MDIRTLVRTSIWMNFLVSTGDFSFIGSPINAKLKDSVKLGVLFMAQWAFCAYAVSSFWNQAMANWVSFNFRSISIKCLKWEYCWCNKFNKLDQSKKYSSKFLMVVLSLPISITLKFLARICGRQMNTRSICMEVYNVLELLMTIL